jgi:hypothetical protein
MNHHSSSVVNVTGSTTLGGVVSGGVEVLTAGGPISLTSLTTTIVGSQPNPVVYTLAPGTLGQLKIIGYSGVTSDLAEVHGTFIGGTTLLFADTAQSAILVATPGGWTFAASNAANLA